MPIIYRHRTAKPNAGTGRGIHSTTAFTKNDNYTSHIVAYVYENTDTPYPALGIVATLPANQSSSLSLSSVVVVVVVVVVVT